jgi:hypothetical protein
VLRLPAARWPRSTDRSRPGSAVVADGGLYEAERQLKVACRLGGVTVVVAYGRDDLPDVFAGSRQPGASAWSVGEPDERMLIHPQPLFHVTLCQGAGGQVHALRVPAKTRDRGIVQPDAQRMTHVVHCNTVRYGSRVPAVRPLERLRTTVGVPRGFRTVHPLGWMSGKVK